MGAASVWDITDGSHRINTQKRGMGNGKRKNIRNQRLTYWF